jgi:group I intron endonuclease
MNGYGVIYAIVNPVTSDIYIGSTVDYKKRISQHRKQLIKNKHHSYLLQRSFNKHKVEFIFEILTHEPIQTLRSREAEFFEILKPKYNVSKDTVSPMAGRKHSPETREKMRLAPRIKGIKRTPWSEETRRKQYLARVGKKRSEEFRIRRRLEAINDNRSRHLKSYTQQKRKKIKDSLGNIFDSMLECSKYHNVSRQTVCDILKGRHYKTRAGVSFFYA